MWENAGGSFTYAGRIYQVRGARPGPAPAHRIRIWTGVRGPRALHLTGQLADGILVSTAYVSPERLLENNRRIDAGAEQAGRAPADVRRGYNLMGVLDVEREAARPDDARPGYIYGTVEDWVSEIVRFYRDYGQDTFIFWPVAGNELLQIEVFAKEVVPAVREAIRNLA
jgi:alkanesulfonate monooxygenase SsuD/methylene tetrahydromethanopterin reductase-like flavin-dependent oxidoreductase (luciferase family)